MHFHSIARLVVVIQHRNHICISLDNYSQAFCCDQTGFLSQSAVLVSELHVKPLCSLNPAFLQQPF